MLEVQLGVFVVFMLGTLGSSCRLLWGAFSLRRRLAGAGPSDRDDGEHAQQVGSRGWQPLVVGMLPTSLPFPLQARQSAWPESL
jgi:hypothetical protein